MSKKNKIEITVVLDNIRSMHNIGSIFRTCDAIGSSKIFLCGICGTPPHKEIHKTALGSTQHIKWKYFAKTEDAVRTLKNDNYEIISIEQTNKSIALNNFDTNQTKIALIFGNEVKGVSEKIISLSSKCIEIPQNGIKKSMNVAVAVGIVLWAITNKSY